MDDLHASNSCLANPGLAIHGSASPLVKYANTFNFKANGRFSPAVTTADAPSLATATLVAPFPNGTAQVVSSLAFDDGTVPATTNSCQFFTLVATLPYTEAGTPTFSWLAGAPFPKHRQGNSGDIARPSGTNQCEIGYVYVKNESSALFIPGTTNLDATGITVTYSNNYANYFA